MYALSKFRLDWRLLREGLRVSVIRRLTHETRALSRCPWHRIAPTSINLSIYVGCPPSHFSLVRSSTAYATSSTPKGPLSPSFSRANERFGAYRCHPCRVPICSRLELSWAHLTRTLPSYPLAASFSAAACWPMPVSWSDEPGEILRECRIETRDSTLRRKYSLPLHLLASVRPRNA